MTAKVEFSGATLRAYAKGLAEMGLLERFFAQAPAQTAEVIRHPPFSGQWVHAAVVRDVLQVVFAVGGPKAVWDCGFYAATRGAAAVIAPVVKTLGTMFGLTPASLFSRMKTLTSSTLRGFEFQYTPETETSGLVRTVMAESYPSFVFLALEGSLAAAFHYCGVQGTLKPTKAVAGSANEITYRAEWGPAPRKAKAG